MSEIETKNAVELSLEEMDKIAGGAFVRPAEKKGYDIYQIQKGENLSRIARKFKCTVKDLVLWNPKITNPDLIYAGDYLYIKKA